MLDHNGNYSPLVSCPLGYQEEKEKLPSIKQERILKSVRAVLEDENKIKEIMSNYNKETEN